MNDVTTVGIDVAKNVFSLHGFDAEGAVVLRRSVKRAKLLEPIAQLSPCLIGGPDLNSLPSRRRGRSGGAHGGPPCPPRERAPDAHSGCRWPVRGPARVPRVAPRAAGPRGAGAEN